MKIESLKLSYLIFAFFSACGNEKDLDSVSNGTGYQNNLPVFTALPTSSPTPVLSAAPTITPTPSPDQMCKKLYGEFSKLQSGSQCECLPGYEWFYDLDKNHNSCKEKVPPPPPSPTPTPVPQFKFVIVYDSGGNCFRNPDRSYRSGSTTNLLFLEDKGCRFSQQIGDIYYCNYSLNCVLSQSLLCNRAYTVCGELPQDLK